MDDDFSVLPIHRRDQPVGAKPIGKIAGELNVHVVVAKQRRPQDHLLRAQGQHRLRAFDRAYAAADATGEQPADVLDE